MISRDNVEVKNQIDLQTALEINNFFPLKRKRVTIKSYKDLRVYQIAFDTSIRIVQLSKKNRFKKKRNSALEQIRHSSRAVCTHLAAACQKSHDLNAFVTKLNDSYLEAKQTQTWIYFAVQGGYLDVEIGQQLNEVYNQILGSLIKMFKESQN